jgi:hypothetical protein
MNSSPIADPAPGGDHMPSPEPDQDNPPPPPPPELPPADVPPEIIDPPLPHQIEPIRDPLVVPAQKA